jgi:hypothetical protein
MITVRSPGGARGRSVLRQLERAFNQSGAIVGEVYALAARGLLTRLERIEDRAVARRFRRRRQARAPEQAPKEPPRAQPAPSNTETSA